MNDDNIKFAIWFIPVIVGSVTVVLKWTTNHIASKERIAIAALKEKSAGETEIKSIREELAEAKRDRKQMHEDLNEMKEEFRFFKQEIRQMIKAISEHGIEEVNQLLIDIKKLNQK